MAATTKNDAPSEIPRMPGSASGLRVTPWATAPAAPRPAPTASAIRVRGPRTSRTITWASESSKPVKAPTTSCSEIDSEPRASEARPAAATAASSAARPAVGLSAPVTRPMVVREA